MKIKYEHINVTTKKPKFEKKYSRKSKNPVKYYNPDDYLTKILRIPKSHSKNTTNIRSNRTVKRSKITHYLIKEI